MKGKILILASITLAISCNTVNKNATATQKDTFDPNISYAVLMGETLLHKYPDLWSMEGQKDPYWTYTNGLISKAMIDLWEHTGQKKYLDYAKAYVDALVDENGIIATYRKSDYNIDKINSGKVLFRLYDITAEERYKTAIDTLRAQLREQPRTKIGGFWHKKRYPHQMWLDGLYMGGPFYAQYAKEFNEPESFDEVSLWFTKMEKVARDPSTGLLYHGWDESREQAWANKETGQAQCFWGRAVGWYAMALVDVLDFLPEDYAGRDSFLDITNRLAEAVVKCQDPETGVWYQILNQGDREGNYLEGSVSSMLSYFLLKAINKGYIDKKIYLEPAKKAFEGTVANLLKVEADSSLIISPVCAVAGLGGNPYRSGTYEYYINEAQRDNDPKAVGPFIMAAIQYENLSE